MHRSSALEEWSMSRPWVSVNFAISADGKISSAKRIPSGWTSEADHRRLIELRKNADALLVGKGTLVADRMTLTTPEEPRQPLRCIVTHSGKIPPDHPIFLKEGGDIHVCVTENSTAELSGATVHHLPLPGFLLRLADDFGVRRLHCEGGGELVRALMELDAVDEIHLTLAGHTLFGGANAPTVTGVPGPFGKASRDFELTHFEPLPDSGECFLSYRRKPGAGSQ